eukprot:g1779.t1
MHVVQLAIRYAWHGWPDTTRRQIRASLLQIAASGSAPAGGATVVPRFLREKLARLLAEVAKREFPQRWPDFMEQMLQMSAVAVAQAELAWLTLSLLAEDCSDADFNAEMPATRRREVLQGLNALFPALYAAAYGLVERQYGAIKQVQAQAQAKSSQAGAGAAEADAMCAALRMVQHCAIWAQWPVATGTAGHTAPSSSAGSRSFVFACCTMLADAALPLRCRGSAIACLHAVLSSSKFCDYGSLRPGPTRCDAASAARAMHVIEACAPALQQAVRALALDSSEQSHWLEHAELFVALSQHSHLEIAACVCAAPSPGVVTAGGGAALQGTLQLALELTARHPSQLLLERMLAMWLALLRSGGLRVYAAGMLEALAPPLLEALSTRLQCVGDPESSDHAACDWSAEHFADTAEWQLFWAQQLRPRVGLVMKVVARHHGEVAARFARQAAAALVQSAQASSGALPESWSAECALRKESIRDFSFAAKRPSTPLFYQLGDVIVRARRAGTADAWQTSTTGSRAAPVAAQRPAPPGTFASADLSLALSAGGLGGLGLNVSRSYRADGSNGDVLVTYDLLNVGAAPLELGAFGVAMVFDQIFSGKSLEQVGSSCSFVEPYAGADAGFVQVTPASGRGALLLVMPEPDTADGIAGVGHSNANSFEAFARLHDDRTPTSVTFEGFHAMLAYSAAYAAPGGEWAYAAEGPFNDPRSALLRVGGALRLTYRLALVEPAGGAQSSALDARAAALHARGRPSTFAAPGYIVTPEMADGASLFVTPAPGRVVASWAVNRPELLRVTLAQAQAQAKVQAQAQAQAHAQAQARGTARVPARSWRFALASTADASAELSRAPFRIANALTQALLLAAGGTVSAQPAAAVRAAAVADAGAGLWVWHEQDRRAGGGGGSTPGAAALCVAPGAGTASTGAASLQCLALAGPAAPQQAFNLSSDTTKWARWTHVKGRLTLAAAAAPPLALSTHGGAGAGDAWLWGSCDTSGCDADQVWELQPASYGRARLTVRFDDGARQTIHLRTMPPLDQAAAAYAAHLVQQMWFNGTAAAQADPFGRAPSFLNWNARAHSRIEQEDRAWIAGLSDECGASPSVGAAAIAEAAFLPAPDQRALVAALRAYTLQTLAPPGARDARDGQGRGPVPATPSLQGVDGSVRASLFYSGRSDFKYNTKPGWDGPRAATTWRSYNYPHPTAVYLAQYRLARNFNASSGGGGGGGSAARLAADPQQWPWYLRRAVNTTLAAAAYGRYNQFGLMLGSVWTQLVRVLAEEEGEEEESAAVGASAAEWAAARAAIEAWALARARGWNASAFPFGSEMPWDSTGQEEIHAWLSHFAASRGQSAPASVAGFAAQAAATVDAVRAYMPDVPSWAYHGNGRRYFDFLVYGDPVLSRGTEREFHHYGAPLNALPLLAAFEAGMQTDAAVALLSVALGGVLGSFTNIRPGSGAPSMGWHGDPASLRRDGYSCDYGVGFLGAVQSVGAYVVRHSAHGPLCFLCNVEEAAVGALVVRPHSLSQRRVFFAPASLSVRAENAQIQRVTFDESARTFDVAFAALAAAGAAGSTARFAVSVTSVHSDAANVTVVELNGKPFHAPVSRGAFEVPLGLGSVSEVRCAWATGRQAE